MFVPEVERTTCTLCKGNGDCYLCEGTGEGQKHYSGAEYIGSDPCLSCDGDGKCPGCKGSGWVFAWKDE